MADQRRPATKRGKKKKTTKKPLSPADRLQRRVQTKQKNDVRSVFSACGFTRIPGASDREFTFANLTSDLDDVFVLENVVVLVEYTIAADVSEHLKKKDMLYRSIMERPHDFLQYAQAAPLNIRADGFAHTQCELRVLYCSKHDIDSELKEALGFIRFFEADTVEYFRRLALSIKRSARQ